MENFDRDSFEEAHIANKPIKYLLGLSKNINFVQIKSITSWHYALFRVKVDCMYYVTLFFAKRIRSRS